MTAWTVDQQAPRSMTFSRQEHWSGLPFPTLQGIRCQINGGISRQQVVIQTWSSGNVPGLKIGV